MKKNFLVLASAVLLLAGLTITAGAQNKSANLENLSANKTETRIYDKKGNLVYAVYRYDATELPKDVKSLVRSIYYDYEIAGVEEVQVPGDTNSIYFVHVQNDDELKTVKVYGGETELIKEYKRG